MNRKKCLGCICLSLLLAIGQGCDWTGITADQSPSLGSNVDVQGSRENQATLATPAGWTKSEPLPLAPEDHGFTIAYDHESGLAVTLYQFTRGHQSIPNDLDSPIVKDELEKAKRGIEQARDLGYYQAAKEVDSKTVKLGDSEQKALWSLFQLTVDGKTIGSDIYVWSKNNTLFKLRCTSRGDESESNQEILKPLLTVLGSGR